MPVYEDITAIETWLNSQLVTTEDSLPAQVFLFGMPPLSGGIRKTETVGVFAMKAVAPGPNGPEMKDIRFSCKYVVAIELIDEATLPEMSGSGIHLS